jgi:AraC family transcriptional regulator, transcriptional activator of pobA
MDVLDKKIKPLLPNELFDFYFREEWKMKIGGSYGLFHINRLEDVLPDIKFPLPPHRKTVYDFIFLTEGTSKRSKGLDEFEFSDNTFFFIPAFQITSHEFIKADSKGFFCYFDAQIFDDIFPHNTFFDDISFLQAFSEPIVKVNSEMKAFIVMILERLEKNYLNPQTNDLGLISLLLVTIFKELELVKQKQVNIPQKAASTLTKKYKNLLAQHIYKTKTITDYAEMLSISPDFLNRSVKAVTGKTAKEVLTDMIVLEAKVMLRQTDLSVGEIAFKLAETNPSDFIRLFKSKVGKTPRKYQQ